MARTDVIRAWRQASIGTSAALHLAKRGRAVALVDRRGPGEETSLWQHRRAIEGNTLFAHAFPKGFGALLRIALKQAPEANYHLAALAHLAPWLLAYRANTRGARSMEFAETMRPLYANAVAEHELLMSESGSTQYLRKDGWLKLYRSDDSFNSSKPERDYAGELGLTYRLPLGAEEARARILAVPGVSACGAVAVRPRAFPIRLPSPRPMRRSLPNRAASSSRVTLSRCIDRAAGGGVETDEGPVDANDALIALGPWAPDVLGPLGIKLPLAFKRGYHRHYRSRGNAGLTSPNRRHRLWLLPRSDGAGRPADHWCGVR